MDIQWTIRKAVPDDAAGVAKVHVDSWRTTYQGIIKDEFLASLSYEKSKERWRNRFAKNPAEHAMFVAEDEVGRIFGFADGGRERSSDSDYDAELYAIYLLQEYQRRGVGRQLFRHLVAYLASNNFHALMVWVLNDNPSRIFYESLGGQLVQKKTLEIGRRHLHESAYGWPDLASLQAELEA